MPAVGPALLELCLLLLLGVGAGLVVDRVLRRLARRLGVAAGRTPSAWDDAVAAALGGGAPFVLAALGAVAALRFTPAPPIAVEAVTKALHLAVLVQLAVWVGAALGAFVRGRLALAEAEGRVAEVPAWNMMSWFGRAVAWVLVGLGALDTLGVDVTALLAGVGIGGLAIGLAVQNILGDLFASLSIVLDRPFVIGDLLVIGDVTGTVEHIGLKTTRVRALSGEQVVLSNADLLQSRVRNFQRLRERRVVVTFGITYETPPEQVAAVPAVAAEVIAEQPATRLERVHFVRLGESSLDYEVVYHLADPDFNRHMDVQQAVLLGLFRRLGARGISFAYPTRTLHLAPAAAADPRPNSLCT